MSESLVEIDCGEIADIAQVAALYSRLRLAIDDGLSVRLNISRLERVDTAFLQLLYSFQRDAVAKGVRLDWSKPAQPFCEAVGILGMPDFYRLSA